MATSILYSHIWRMSSNFLYGCDKIVIFNKERQIFMFNYYRLKDLREDKDKTQKDIAQIIGTSHQYYQKYEKGIYDLPLQRAIQLADYYNVSLDYLAGRTNNKNIV